MDIAPKLITTLQPIPRKDSAQMLVDAPMTPPTSPLPQDTAPSQQPDVPTTPQSEPPPSFPSESIDQIMELQNLQLTQNRGNTMDIQPLDNEWQSSEHPEPPLRSLEDESSHLVPSSNIKLSDFDVVETLGKCMLVFAAMLHNLFMI